jgi:iron complex outermembrane receptor protein
MPNARLIWTPDKKNSVWGAISRAVSPPSRVFQDIRFPVASVPPQTTDGLPTLIEIVGDRQVQAAEVLSYETGYRSEITEGLSLDLAFYYSRYKRILTQEPGTPYVDIPHKGTTPTVIVPLRFANGLAAQSFGSEIALEWRPTSWWRLVTAYSYLEMNSSKDTTKDASSNYLLVVGSAARHQALVRSLIDITDKTSFDSTLRFVDNLRFGDIDAYTELDVRLGWKASKDIELSLIGKNLLDSHHPEYIGNLFGPLPLEINRQILGSILWSF